MRTLGIGHPFTQGTVDSNEIWVELIARSGGRVIGRSGGIGPDGTVDPYSHFINVYMLDRNGNRIDRRNPQDIFVPLYNKQIPPGAGQVVHFALELPSGDAGPITLEAKVNYRKFDRTYLNYIFGKGKGPTLPVVVMARDLVRLPVEGGPPAANDPSPIEPAWQRWNDYGIGLLLEGATKGGQKGELKQAEEVFRKVAELEVADGWVNLARVYQREGRIPDAAGRAREGRSPQGAGRAVGHQLAHRPDQRQQRHARRGDPELRVGAGDQDPRPEVRFQPRLRGDQRAGEPRITPAPAADAGIEPRAHRSTAEDDRHLPPDARHRFRERRRPITSSGQAFGDAAWGDRKSTTQPPESGSGGADGTQGDRA